MSQKCESVRGDPVSGWDNLSPIFAYLQRSTRKANIYWSSHKKLSASYLYRRLMESICCSWQKAKSSCCKRCRCREFSSWICPLPTSFVFCISCVVVGFLLVSLVGEKCFDQENSSYIFGRWFQATELCVCSRTFAPDPVQRKNSACVSLIFEHIFDWRQFSVFLGSVLAEELPFRL